MINILDSKEVSIDLSAPNKAGLLFSSDMDENEDILLLVMPVMLNNYV